MIPHAPLRRVLFVTISGCLLGGLLLYFEHGMFVVGAFMGGSIGAALISLEIFILRRNAGAFFPRLRIPTKPATHSNRKPATDSDLKPAGVPI